MISRGLSDPALPVAGPAASTRGKRSRPLGAKRRWRFPLARSAGAVPEQRRVGHPPADSEAPAQSAHCRFSAKHQCTNSVLYRPTTEAGTSASVTGWNSNVTEPSA